MEWLSTFWTEHWGDVVTGLFVAVPTTILAVIAIFATPRPLWQRRRIRNKKDKLIKSREEYLARLENLAQWIGLCCLPLFMQLVLLGFVATVILTIYVVDTFLIDIAPKGAWDFSKGNNFFNLTCAAIGLGVITYQYANTALELFYYARPDIYLKLIDDDLARLEKDEELLP